MNILTKSLFIKLWMISIFLIISSKKEIFIVLFDSDLEKINVIKLRTDSYEACSCFILSLFI